MLQGTPEKRIVFTKDPGTGTQPPEWADDIRLVDEPTVTRGRLQIKYHGKWRGVCANFQKYVLIKLEAMFLICKDNCIPRLLCIIYSYFPSIEVKA